MQSWRVGNSSVVCSRIYLQAARGRGKGNEHNAIILNLTSWSWHILYPSPQAMSIITTLAFSRFRLLVKLWFQLSSPLYPLWRPLSHQPISAQNKDVRLTWQGQQIKWQCMQNKDMVTWKAGSDICGETKNEYKCRVEVWRLQGWAALNVSNSDRTPLLPLSALVRLQFMTPNGLGSALRNNTMQNKTKKTPQWTTNRMKQNTIE